MAYRQSGLFQCCAAWWCRVYGIVGLLLLAGMVCVAFFPVSRLSIWVTPIGWYGYILATDHLVRLRRGRSLLIDNTAEFCVMLPYSIALWGIFELHNLRFMNWEYVGEPLSYGVTLLGSLLAFATILPAMYITWEALRSFNLFSFRTRPQRFSRRRLYAEMLLGAVLIAITVIVPSPYTGPLVWAGYFLLIVPLNYCIGAPSILTERDSGSMSGMLTLMCAGLVCGFVWEFLNFRAGAKWVYHVPYFENIKIFEMPVLGFLGFAPFAVTFVEMYRFVRWVGRKK